MSETAKRTILDLHKEVKRWKKSWNEQYHKKELLSNVIRDCRKCNKKANEMFAEFEGSFKETK